MYIFKGVEYSPTGYPAPAPAITRSFLEDPAPAPAPVKRPDGRVFDRVHKIVNKPKKWVITPKSGANEYGLIFYSQ